MLPVSVLCKYLSVMGDLNARTGTSAEFNNFDLSRTIADYYGIDDQTIGFINNAHDNYQIRNTLMCQINVLMLTKIHRFFRN